ncbi:alpha/beta hydrolase family protein [Anthocerotibacter panamensis]|uniref:alpha/beta hydrolase family protein n=1 Tax=Anthocerotibacter panamensis TaxID=2857077 RepID=UPI001C407A46|nr:alpha/beta fold hydrolase [Anthocerotibacter panamensis]
MNLKPPILSLICGLALTTALWPLVNQNGLTLPNPLPAALAQFQTNSLYKAQPGPYSVGVADDLTLNDSRRNRTVPLKIYYPDGPGPFPVIVFSHGGGGTKDAFSELSFFWASHGYVSIHPTHLDHDLKREQQGSSRRELGEIAKTDSTLWQSRTDDISLIISSLGSLEQQVPALSGKFDNQHIGVAGHSFGAATALMVAGTKIDTNQSRDISFRDPRVKAFIAISPDGAGQRGLDPDAWNQITTPVMTIAGSLERGDTFRMEPYQGMPPGDKYHMVVDGARHYSFNDAKTDGGRQRGRQRGGRRRGNQDGSSVDAIHTLLGSTSVAFWDAYLMQNGSAKQYLAAKGPAIFGAGAVTFFAK